jgi:hypothetical protein
LLSEDFLCDICNVMNFLQAIHNMFLVHFSHKYFVATF